VRLASYGATGPARVFEGARGYFATYVHGFAADIATQVSDLGDRWETPNLAYKPYPACHYTHAPIDALAQVLKEHPLRPDEISGIVAFTDDTGVSLVLEPVADKLTPRTAYDAKFSLPYCLATQIVHGSVDVSSFTPEAIVDADVLALTPLVTYERRQYSPRPDAFGGGVRLTTTDGRTYEAELRHQRGGSENPICDADVVEKFRANASLALPQDKVSELEERMLDLETQDDLSFLGVLRTAARRGA
jgi:2-methylcitrate dehydratase PrpD